MTAVFGDRDPFELLGELYKFSTLIARSFLFVTIPIAIPIIIIFIRFIVIRFVVRRYRHRSFCYCWRLRLRLGVRQQPNERVNHVRSEPLPLLLVGAPALEQLVVDLHHALEQRRIQRVGKRIIARHSISRVIDKIPRCVQQISVEWLSVAQRLHHKAHQMLMKLAERVAQHIVRLPILALNQARQFLAAQFCASA